ncbi:TetR/AcrR family transcriptional regulator OS=Streptomyces tendae OX=1932 GN=GUR47_29620 PE=4 SV=1 [Streptomyces tendae]
MNTTQRPDQQTSADRRRRELLEAADRVVLRDGPHASMNAIAAEAGITKPILYRHFGDKGGLYAALAVRHTDALLASLRAALDAPAERRQRVEATLDTYLAAIEARPQVYRFLMHPAESAGSPGDQSEQGCPHVGKHSAPLLRRMGEELAQVIEERLDVGPGTQQLARVWGHGIVGMMHAAGDWWLGERPCPREELVRTLADLLWGRLAEAGDKAGGPGFDRPDHCPPRASSPAAAAQRCHQVCEDLDQAVQLCPPGRIGSSRTTPPSRTCAAGGN